MATYEGIKRHKHARRHDKNGEVFSTLLQDSPSLNNEALFFSTLLQDSPSLNNEALFSQNHKRLAVHSVGWLEDCWLSFSASLSAALSWKVDEAQSMPLKASNSASLSIKPAGSTSGAKICLRVGGTRLTSAKGGAGLLRSSLSYPV